MKTYLLTAVIWFSFIVGMYAQTAANYYNNGKASFDQASVLLSKMSVFDKAANDKIIDLYTGAATNYLNAEKAMGGLKYIAYYNASVSLYKAAVQCEAGAEDQKAYDLMKQVLDLWPTLSSLPASKVCKEKSISRKGFVYIFPAADTIPGWSYNYYMSRYLLSVLSNKENKPDDALKFAEEVADNFKANPEITRKMAYFAAMVFRKQGNICGAGKYASINIENISPAPLSEDEPNMKTKNKELMDMSACMIAADSQKCIKNKLVEGAVAILASLKEPWKINPHPVYDMGDLLFLNGVHSFKLIFSEYKLAMFQGDSNMAHVWDSRLMENKRHFSSADWRTLADFYDSYLTKTHLRDDAIKSAQKKELQEATHVLIGIEPSVIPLGQYAAGIQVVGKYVSHELRVGYIADGIKPFLKDGTDTDHVALYMLTHYNGIQLSYSFKILSKGEYDPHATTYIGAEFRYTMRNYTDLLTYYNKNDSTEHVNNVNLKPQASVYDATLLFGEIIRGKKLFFELFGGVGVGYKSITYSNPGFNPNTDAVANAPFKSNLWDKIYVPVRLGVKIGLVL